MPVEVAFASSSQDVNEDNDTGTIKVSLSEASHTQVTVEYAITGGSAIRGEDYTLSDGTLTFNSGETSKTISVRIVDDALDEQVETIWLELNNPDGNVIMGEQTDTVLEINDNDSEPDITINTINDISVTEGDSGPTSAILDVRLSSASGKSIEVAYTTVDDTASAGEDYNQANGTLTFAPGETSKTVTVKIIGDITNEADERFFVKLSNVVNAFLLEPQAEVIIADDDDIGLSINDVTRYEGADGTTTSFVFEVTLSNVSNQTVAVDYATAEGTAKVADGDYTSIRGMLTFAPGETSKTITVKVHNDTADELDETFFVNLSNQLPTSVPINDGQGVGTIEDDDGPNVRFDSTTYTVDEDAATATITATLSQTSVQTVTVDYAVTGNSATAGTDFIQSSGILTFTPGVDSQTFTVDIIDDITKEDDEEINLALSNPDNATLVAPDSATLTIIDDEPLPTVQFADPDTPVDEGSGAVDIAVTLSNPSAFTVTVNYTTGDNTAIAPDDYTTTVNGILTFAPGEITRTITINIIDDLIDEADETIDVTLSNPNRAILGTPTRATVTITDNETMPTVQFATTDRTVDEGSATVTIPVTLNNPSAFTVTVEYTGTGDATPVDDYALSGTSLTFSPGEITRTITINLNDDTTDEADETLVLTLRNPNNAILGTSDTYTLTLQDNDTAPDISVNDVTVTEGSTAVFTVTLSNPSGKEVRVDYATANGTATAGADYTASTTTTLTFAPGDTSKTIPIQVKDDTIDEDNETFFVNLSNPTSATIPPGSNQAVGTIIDDDDTTISIDDISINEGDSDSGDAIFTVTLSNPSSREVRVDYATTDDTALAGVDYSAISGMLTFAPGDTSETVIVQVTGDTTDEVDKTFFVNLSNAQNATIADNQGEGTIIDNDAPPTVSFITPDRNELEDAGNIAFTVELSAPSGKIVTVNSIATGDATAGDDYTLGSTVLTFNPGETTKTIPVTIIDDSIDESEEKLILTLSSATNASVGAADNVTLTIQDNDAAPDISINDVTVTEGDSGTVNATFTISLSAESGQTVTVDYATADVSATAGDDYTAVPSTMVTFDPGDTSQTITVEVLSDTLDEANETFAVELSDATNATITDNQGVGMITDDDGPKVSFAAANYSVNEDSGQAVIIVTLSATSPQPVTVKYVTSDETPPSATAAVDYTATSGILSFKPGESSRVFTIDITNDTSVEDTETLQLTLSNPVNADLGSQTTATLEIIDNEPYVQFSNFEFGVNESAGTAIISVELSDYPDTPVTVNYAIIGGDATNGVDYSLVGNSLTFGITEKTKPITVTINNDGDGEPDEDIILELTSVSSNNAAIDGSSAYNFITTILTIFDSEQRVQFSEDSYTVDEDTGTATITVELNQAATTPVTVDYATADGSATAGDDYTATSGMLTFAPGETSKTFDVGIRDNTAGEPDETVMITLSNPSANAWLGLNKTATLHILDDEPRVQFSQNNYMVDEDAGTATITVELSHAATNPVRVDYATSDNDAIAGDDYIATSGTFTFAPGETSKTFTVNILDDNAAESDEQVRLALSNPSPNASVSILARLHILDNEPHITFMRDTFNVDENDGTATITVIRTGRDDLVVTMDYATSNDSAQAGSDYTATMGTLTFGVGETSKTFTVDIINDNRDEHTEILQLTLSNLSSNAWMQDGSAELEINDDDPAAVISFSPGSYSINEGLGQQPVTVRLNTPSDKLIPVKYATADGSAVAGEDYLAMDGTLTFNPGETSKTVIITLINEETNEVDETMSLTLSNANNAVLGTPSTATVTIVDND